MKSKIDITVSADLDEIRYQLIESLTVKELISFVMDLGDNMSETESYYIGLKKQLEKLKWD